MGFTKWNESNLPIFHQPYQNGHLLYTPGYLLYSTSANPENTKEMEAWKPLFTRAKEVIKLSEDTINEFSPVSLHIYLTQYCNLNCIYCFTTPQRSEGPRLVSIPAIEAAVHYIAENCQKTGQAFTLVCHGGGEPTLDNRLEEIAVKIKRICNQYRVRSFFYLATNGVYSKEKAHLMCKMFDLIGLSCDGPPEIQNKQRKMLNGKSSSFYVERTAAIFHELHQAFDVRVTVTEDSWQKLPRIAKYLVSTIRPAAINVELTYLNGASPIKEDEIDEYVQLYLEARKISTDNGIQWLSSTNRLNQLHQRYCHVFHKTLQIIPGDIASLCFADCNARVSENRNTVIGQFSTVGHDWKFEQQKIYNRTNALTQIPEICDECFLQFHCSRDCPNQCPLSSTHFHQNSFCELQQKLHSRLLEQVGNELIIQLHQPHQSAIGTVIQS